MKQRRTSSRLCKGTIAMLCGLVSAGAFASGFQLQEQSASGLGVAYSGLAAASQDASIVFWNPAGMSSLPGSDIAVVANYLVPSFRFKSSGSTYDGFGDGGNAGVSTLVPALYVKTSLTPSVAVGLAVNSPFGLSTDWNSQWAGMFYAVKSKVETLNVNPAISYKVNDVLSLGAGVSYQRLKATLTQAVTPLIPTAQGRLDGSDWAWGWNLGVLLDFGQGTRVGATYRSAANNSIRGDLSFNTASLAPLNATAQASLKLPQTASLGVAQQFGSKLRALIDYSWTGWNSISSLAVIATSGPLAGQPVVDDALNFKSSWRVGLGLEYRLVPAWLLRGGLAYDRSPVEDAFRTPRLPDNDRKWLAVGARWEPSSDWSVDLGYAYLWVKDGPSELTSPGPVPGALLGTYTSNTSILGVQASFHF
ncbi:MAG: outer membrane protein transport protein [Proteobacteria bacterium]|nr:outer membrane protein transport protein [Pseudomonadota bacterium]